MNSNVTYRYRCPRQKDHRQQRYTFHHKIVMLSCQADGLVMFLVIQAQEKLGNLIRLGFGRVIVKCSMYNLRGDLLE